jgi:hypothetical protein
MESFFEAIASLSSGTLRLATLKNNTSRRNSCCVIGTPAPDKVSGVWSAPRGPLTVNSVPLAKGALRKRDPPSTEDAMVFGDVTPHGGGTARPAARGSDDA